MISHTSPHQGVVASIFNRVFAASSVRFLSIVSLILTVSTISYSQTNRFVDPSGTDTGTCNSYGSPCQSIDYAISQSSNGDFIYLSDGTFAASTISERVTLKGNGSGSVVQGITVNAAVSGSDLVTISDLTVSGTSVGVLITTSFVNLDQLDVSNHTSRNVSLNVAGDISDISITGCTLDGGGITNTSLHVSESTGVDGLTVLNTSMDNSTFGVYFTNGSSSTLNHVDNVIFRNCTFNDNLRKGIYVEKLQNALFESVSVINSGTDATYGFNNGVDINLKWQSYSNIIIRNSRIEGCGAIGSNDIGTAPENRRSSAIAIKARTDAPSYTSPTASLTNVTLDGVIIDGLVTDLRFGEMGKTDNSGIDMSTVTISHCSIVNDNLAGLLNEENSNVLTISNNYWGGGTPSGTDIEDYGSGAGSTSQSGELANQIVDDLNNSYTSFANALIGVLAGGTIQNVPIGTIAGTTTISKNVTLSTPGAGLRDALNSLTTFEDLVVNGGVLTLGSDFSVSGTVSLSDDILIGDYQVDGAAVSVNSGANIQDGIDMIISGGTVTVSSATFNESLLIEKPLTLDGSAGAILDPSVPAVAIDIDSDDVVIDGFQIGTNASTSNAIIGINSFRNDNITIQNNTVNANTIGISANITETGATIIDNNVITMLNLEDVISSNGSIGISLNYAVGDSDVDLTDNNISNAVSGIFAFGLTSSSQTIIDGGSYTGCTTGILPINTDGISFSPSTLTVQNLTMSGFATDIDVSDTETAVYAITVGGTAADDITITIDNLDVSGVNNDLSNYSGIVIADFPSASDGAGVDAAITNCNIHDNENRGIYVRGGDAVASISQSLITGNGFDPTATGGNPGFSVIVREGGSATVSSSFITNPAALSAAEDIPSNYYLSGLHISTGGSLTVSNCNLDQNGNGFIAETSGIDLSGNFFNSIDEATIQSLVGSGNDFTPWLNSGTDTDLLTSGFQGDFDGLIVGTLNPQTSGDRIQEAHDLLNTDGTITILQDDYAETLTIGKDISIDPEAGTTIDDITLDGGRLNVLASLEINNVLTLTDGILDIDLDDGDKSDDPVLILNNDVTGSFDDSNHVEGKISKSIAALGNYFFPVGDADTYRPVTLEPLNAATFGVSHVEDATPIGAGPLGTIEDLVGTLSSVFNPLNIESVMNFRYWTIDVLSGVPGLSTITLQAASQDRITDPSSLGILRFDGADWLELTLLGGAGSNPYTVSATTVSFSDFTLYSSDVDANPLPVELESFEGSFEGKDIRLNWSTLSEVNSDYFQIERSEDEVSFKPVGTVSSNGNTNRRYDYSYIDMNVSEQVYYYRLKLVDFDGYYEYSSTIQVSPDLSDIKVLVYPNPSSGLIQIHGVSAKLIDKISFYDLNGRLHLQMTTIDQPAINLSELQNGHYLLRLSMIDGSVFEGEFIKN